jgi:hypothetical protein
MNWFKLLLISTAILIAPFAATPARADSCTCSQQPNGTFWCTCVDNNGNRYCLSCRTQDSSTCTRVSCRP